MKKTAIILGVLLAVLVAFIGYKNGVNSRVQQPRPEDGNPVELSKSLFYNQDSLMYYAEKAYLHDDPKGLFVIGITTYLKAQDPDYPEHNLYVSRDEGDIMLLPEIRALVIEGVVFMLLAWKFFKTRLS